MTEGLDTFDAGWLALREPFDRAARAPGLAARFAETLPDRPEIADLGAGTGATLRAVAPLIPGAQKWVLAERSEALRRAGPEALTAWSARRGWRADLQADRLRIDRPDGPIEVEWRTVDLAADLGAAVEGCAALTASALFDLVSDAWLGELVRLARGRALYAALTVDGETVWSPPDPRDSAIESRFKADQRRDKGFGPALGGEAADRLASLAQANGRIAEGAASPWRIPAGAGGMLGALVDGAVVAAARRGAEMADLEAWRVIRKDQIDRCALSVVVRHRDQLLAPDGRNGSRR